MNHRENKAEPKVTNWHEDKVPNNSPKPIPSATELPVAPGPRLLHTAEAWPRSKYNAVAHGIFAKVVLRGRESSTKYRRLVSSLRESYQPVGAQEEFLVEQLAMLYWRERRVYVAENAEILKGIHSVRWENQARQEEELRRVDTPVTQFNGGLLRYAHNPLIIHRCIEILKDWHELLAEHQLDCELGCDILLQIYGFEDLMIPRGDLPVAYSIIYEQLESAGESKKGRRLARKLKRGLVKHMDREIKRLVRLKGKVRRQQDKRLKFEARTHMVPLASDRLTRYETM